MLFAIMSRTCLAYLPLSFGVPAVSSDALCALISFHQYIEPSAFTLGAEKIKCRDHVL
jgi:hypothetical protein